MAHNGDRQARDYLIETNLKLVYKIANIYRNKIDFDTAVQEGSIGLIKAIDRFEPDRGFKFSTYAVPYIKGSIIHFARDKKEDIPYRVKREDSVLYIKIRNAKMILTEKLNREPTLKEVAQYVDKNIQKVSKAINAVENFTSLQNTKYHNKDGQKDISMIDSIEAQDNILEEQIINKMIIREAMKKLDEKQKKVIELRYIKDLTQVQVGNILNIAQTNISRIEKKTLKVLIEVIQGGTNKKN